MRITAYVHKDKDSLHELGKKHGLKGTALSRFQYALSEVAVELEVDPETGDAEIVTVDGREVAKVV